MSAAPRRGLDSRPLRCAPWQTVAVSTVATPQQAIVLRTLRFGEADVIAHLYTREHGRRNAIAKGARRAKSRLGARLEPYAVLTLMLRQGRGDLAMVQAIELLEGHEHLRASYVLQQVAASALDMLGRLSVEHVANEPAFHLTTNLLRALDALDPTDRVRASALLVAYELKLLHVTGLAPQLGSCTRCGADDEPATLVAWSVRDGGVVCSTCRVPADAALDPLVRGAAAWAMQQSLAAIGAAAELPSGVDLGAASRQLVAPMCAEHAGFRPKPIAN